MGVRKLAGLFLLCLLGWLAGRSWLPAAQTNLAFLRLNRALAEGGAELAPAVATLQEAASHDPRTGVQHGLALALYAADQREQALQVWAALPDGAERVLAWGHQAAGAGAYTDALRLYGYVQQLAPELADGYFYSGRVYAQQQQPTQARQAYLAASERSAFLYTSLSDIYYHLALLPETTAGEAQHYLQQAVTADTFTNTSDEGDARFRYAELLQQAGDPAAALVQYEWVAAHQPRNYRAWLATGRLSWLVHQDAARAEAALLVAREIAPDRPAPYRRLAEIYAATGRTTEAIALYRRVLRLDPNDNQTRRALQALEGSQ